MEWCMVTYRVLDSVRSVRTPDGAVVLDIARGRMFTLDPVASRILELLEDGCASQESLLAGIRASFEVVPESAPCDLNEFLQELCLERLIAADEDAAESQPR